MSTKNKIILPLALLFVGIFSVVFGQSSQVGADTLSQNGNTTTLVLLTASGFLLIAVSAIVALFMIASSEDKK